MNENNGYESKLGNEFYGTKQIKNFQIDHKTRYSNFIH